MSGISKQIYQRFPHRLRKKLGSIKWLKPIRDMLLRTDGTYREIAVLVEREYGGIQLSFKFFASIKVAVKAQKRGMENSLLRLSIDLVKRRYNTASGITLIDVGANFGYLTLVWAQTLARNGQVISFEPHSRVADSLNRSVLANQLDQTVKIYNMAVGKDRGNVLINMAYGSANMDDQPGAIRSEEVALCRLDDYYSENRLGSCHLIKIDVDGRELDVLHGARRLINDFRPIIIIETNNDTGVVKFLTGLGYTVFDRYLTPWKDGDPLPPNAFAIFE